MIDSHVHFYDTNRGVSLSWPPKDARNLHKPQLPHHYFSNFEMKANVGVVAIETSPQTEENLWLSEIVRADKGIMGYVANLPVGTHGFRSKLDQLSNGGYLKGVRLNQKRLEQGLASREFVEDLRYLADQGLRLDLYGNPTILRSAGLIVGMVPNLYIVIDHVANLLCACDSDRQKLSEDLTELGKFENVRCKISGLVEALESRGIKYSENLDVIAGAFEDAWNAFGETRLMYGSNWPICAQYSNLSAVQSAMKSIIETKGLRVCDLIFGDNCKTFYNLKS